MPPLFSMTSNAAALARRVSGWSDAVGPALAAATLKAATVLTAAAKREAPVATGRLRRSIAYQVAGDARYVVAPNTDYAVLVHEGSRPHIIRPNRKTALFWKGAAHPVKVVNHPGNRANRFMTRAVASSRPQLQRIAAEVGHTIVVRQG